MRGSDASGVEHHLLEKQACPVLWVLSSLFLLVVEWEQLDGKRWKPQMTLWNRAHWPRLDYCLRERKNTSLLLVVFQLLCRVRFFAVPWTAARQASLSFTISRSLLKLMSIESMMPPNHLIFCHSLSSCSQPFLASGPFLSQPFASGGQTIGASASASVLPMNIQGWFPLGLTGLNR